MGPPLAAGGHCLSVFPPGGHSLTQRTACSPVPSSYKDRSPLHRPRLRASSLPGVTLRHGLTSEGSGPHGQHTRFTLGALKRAPVHDLHLRAAHPDGRGVGPFQVSCTLTHSLLPAGKDRLPAEPGAGAGVARSCPSPPPVPPAERSPPFLSSQPIQERGCLTSINFELILAGFLSKNIQVLIVSPNYWTATQI